MPTFRNPANGHQETIGPLSVIFSCLFGILYFIYVRSWTAAALSILGYPAITIIAALGSAGRPDVFGFLFIMGWIAWGIAMLPVIEKSFLRRGWIEVKEGAGGPNELRTCPHCAEDIRAAASVCKHCGRDVDPLDTVILAARLKQKSPPLEWKP